MAKKAVEKAEDKKPVYKMGQLVKNQVKNLFGFYCGLEHSGVWRVVANQFSKEPGMHVWAASDVVGIEDKTEPAHLQSFGNLDKNGKGIFVLLDKCEIMVDNVSHEDCVNSVVKKIENVVSFKWTPAES